MANSNIINAYLGENPLGLGGGGLKKPSTK